VPCDRQRPKQSLADGLPIFSKLTAGTGITVRP
jgi:hypothetical protein